MSKGEISFLDHLSELRWRVFDLRGSANLEFYAELKDLTFWIQNNHAFVIAIQKLENNFSKTELGGEWTKLKILSTSEFKESDLNTNVYEKCLNVLKQITKYLFNFYSGTLFNGDIDWEKIKFEGDTVCFGDKGKAIFDVLRRHDQGKDVDRTKSVALLEEIVGYKSDGCFMKDIKSVDTRSVSGQVDSINRRLNSEFNNGNLLAKYTIRSVDVGGKKKLQLIDSSIQ